MYNNVEKYICGIAGAECSYKTIGEKYEVIYTSPGSLAVSKLTQVEKRDLMKRHLTSQQVHDPAGAKTWKLDGTALTVWAPLFGSQEGSDCILKDNTARS